MITLFLNDTTHKHAAYKVISQNSSAPGPVRNVTVELRQGADNVTAVLSWQPPDEPNGVITQYQVLYAGYNGTEVYIYYCFIAVCGHSGYRAF